MLRLGLGPQIGTNTPADSGGAQVIWKVAVYGAGTPTSNGEYVWNGSELQYGKPVYRNGSNTISFGDFGGESAEWGLYDDISGDNTYLSPDLLNWTSNGYGAVPASALSYAQDSYFNFTISGAVPASSNGITILTDPAVNNVWFISSDGINFTGELSYTQEGEYAGLFILYDYTEDSVTFTATSVFGEWTPVGTGVTPPTISNVIYTA